MKLETEICMYRKWSGKDRDRVAERLLGEIRAFADMPNRAFWTEGLDEGETHCIIVRGFMGDLENGECVKNEEIEDVMRRWCRDLANWCREDADTNSENEDYAYKQLRVEVGEHEAEGGLEVTCYDKDGEQDMEIHVLPIRSKE